MMFRYFADVHMLYFFSPEATAEANAKVGDVSIESWLCKTIRLPFAFVLFMLITSHSQHDYWHQK